jgi:thiamine-phosphate pyrophosphorylase
MDLKKHLGLYFIPDSVIGKGMDELTQAELALKGGVTAIQLRSKHRDMRDLYSIGLKLRNLCQQFQRLLIVNDRIDLAQIVHADGIHVGQQDLPVKAIRKLVGKNFVIGVSVSSVQEAQSAEEEGADYISVQSIFPTQSKENVAMVGLGMLLQIVQTVTIPVIGIGGISLANVSSVLENGACGAAVISALAGQKDITSRAIALRKEIDKYGNASRLR